MAVHIQTINKHAKKKCLSILLVRHHKFKPLPDNFCKIYTVLSVSQMEYKFLRLKKNHKTKFSVGGNEVKIE